MNRYILNQNSETAVRTVGVEFSSKIVVDSETGNRIKVSICDTAGL